jgi:hypothetical protein
VLFYLKERLRGDKRKCAIQTNPVFVEDEGKDYGRQRNPTQRNEIMNTYAELKYRQGWILEQKISAEKNPAKKLHISLFCIRIGNNFVHLRRFYIVFILRK